MATKNFSYKESFFNKLSDLLSKRGISFRQLGQLIEGNPRYFEAMQRDSGRVPTLDIIEKICDELKVDIGYFLDRNISDNTKLPIKSDFVFPSDSEIDVSREFRKFLNGKNTFDFQIEFYLYGNEKSYKLYESIRVFTELARAIKTSSSKFKSLKFEVFLPKMNSVEDTLSDQRTPEYPWSEHNSSILELYNQIISDYIMFQQKILNLKNDFSNLSKGISNIKFELHEIENFDQKDDQFQDVNNFERKDNAIVISDFAYYSFTEPTAENNTFDEEIYTYVITRHANRSDSDIENIFRSSFNFSYTTGDKRTSKKFNIIVNIFEQWKEKTITDDDAIAQLSLLKKELIPYVCKLIIVGLPGVGKSTIIKKMAELIGVTVENSDQYINHRIFEDNSKDDSRIMFKKLGDNQKRYLQLRQYGTLSAITKSLGKNGMCDIGGKEIFYDETLLLLIDNNYTIINLVINDVKKDYKAAYISYLQNSENNLINPYDRSNLHKAALVSDNNGQKKIDLNSSNFSEFISELFKKRFEGYQNRSHITIYREKKEDPNHTMLEIMCRIFTGQ